MAYTVGAYYQSVDPGGTFVDLSTVQDPHLTAVDKDLFIPELNNLVGGYFLVDTSITPQIRLRSPGLLSVGFEEYITQYDPGTTPPSSGHITFYDRRTNPLTLTEVEPLRVQVLSDPTAAVAHYAIVFLSDGPIAPAAGSYRTIRASVTATLTAGQWVNTNISFPVALKAGSYQVVGAWLQATNVVAFRLVFGGGAWRPGAIAAGNCPVELAEIFRYGNFGVWGEFAHSSPPTIDILGTGSLTNAALYLDLIPMS